jgi:hypothetical protein
MSAKLATGRQLWRLNQLGLLGDALTQSEDGRVYHDVADRLIAHAADAGRFEPRGKKWHANRN